MTDDSEVCKAHQIVCEDGEQWKSTSGCGSSTLPRGQRNKTKRERGDVSEGNRKNGATEQTEAERLCTGPAAWAPQLPASHAVAAASHKHFNGNPCSASSREKVNFQPPPASCLHLSLYELDSEASQEGITIQKSGPRS
ncbi:unnamed protein product [Pleuronectes platessa]|uniref:Uncharacterized protein n=1 Tax=Pleuronectes platessa TaxID=8262 RepID=A0A9N7TUD5_PLEPL|nr:unnamed protein product [Pleuronectes platessa]